MNPPPPPPPHAFLMGMEKEKQHHQHQNTYNTTQNPQIVGMHRPSMNIQTQQQQQHQYNMNMAMQHGGQHGHVIQQRRPSNNTNSPNLVNPPATHNTPVSPYMATQIPLLAQNADITHNMGMPPRNQMLQTANVSNDGLVAVTGELGQ